MRKVFAAFIILTISAVAANVRLFLKDGSYHVVREYTVQQDRVHYYSIERGDWEDIPLALVDLKRTESEAAAHKTAIEEESKVIAAEEKVEREIQEEVIKIPRDPGVYQLINGKELRILH